MRNNADLLRPVSNVSIVQRDVLRPNDWNPNAVTRENLQLLIQSILTNGWTSPIVCRRDFCIIDGYHRWLVAGMEPLVSLLSGRVPMVIVEHDDPAQDIYGTITHNRARGVHQLGPMKAIVKRLVDAGKSVPEISEQLGMRPEEVFRLSDFSREDFLALMSRDRTYSKARAFIKL